MGGLMMREAGVGYCRKRCSNQQEAGDVAKAVDHCSMCDVIAGLGAAPAGRVDQAGSYWKVTPMIEGLMSCQLARW